MAKHLTMEERQQIAKLHSQLQSQAAIARALGRHRSTICRELGRNRERFAYCPYLAQQMAQERRRQRPLVSKMERPEIRDRVEEGLKQYHSPDQIAGRMKRETPQLSTRVSRQTIYNWIHRRPREDGWSRFLRRSHRNRSGKTGGIVRSVNITGRYEEANQRCCVGHWEGDTVLAARHRGGIVTLVDRKSRLLMAIITKDRKARRVRRKLQQLLDGIPLSTCRSVTFDRGCEFAEHEQLSAHSGIAVFFADPYCPWQRGTNENTNGLLRQFFPKGTSLQEFTPRRLADAVQLLNQRPRRVLNYLTPYEAFHSDLTRAIES